MPFTSARLCGQLLVSFCTFWLSTGSPRLLPPEFWETQVEKGILNESYLRRINCDGTVFDDFRQRFADHVHSGGWNVGIEETWINHNWDLVKKAEEILERFRRADILHTTADDGLSIQEAMMSYRRSASEEPSGILDLDRMVSFASHHLDRISAPSDVFATGTFAGSCLLGVIAAIAVFGRSLVTLGELKPVETDGQEDGFTLWRMEYGYILSGLLLFEGSLLLDLTAVPGWPGLDTRFVEQLLHWRKGDVNATADNIAFAQSDQEKILKQHVIINAPRKRPGERPARFPVEERKHSATDPMGVTSWGRMAQAAMVSRSERLQAFGTDMAHAIQYVGPSWIVPQPPEKKHLETWMGANFLALIHGHPSLDVEIPTLLETLFPSLFRMKYVLIGPNKKPMCRQGVGNSILQGLCSEPHSIEVAPEAAELWRGTALEGRDLISPRDPRLRFASATSGSVTEPPHLISVTSWILAIWAVRHFPDASLILNFGPPLLLESAGAIFASKSTVIQDMWLGLEELRGQVAIGRALICAESLFRAEQFYFQAGFEVPFLRPMSVWVNATYSPAVSTSAPRIGRVLIHNRGRLKYEPFFIKAVGLLAGPNFKYDIVAQRGQSLDFREIAMFHAVVILPWSPELCILRNIFKMRVPLFVPGRSLLRNMVHISNQRLLPAPYYKRYPGLDVEAMSREHPYDPFLDTARPAGDARGIPAKSYWAEYSEFLLLPCLKHFSSQADLLVGLHEFDGQKTSVQMRAAYLQDLQEMRSFWLYVFKFLHRDAA